MKNYNICVITLLVIALAGCRSSRMTEQQRFERSVLKDVPFAVDSISWLTSGDLGRAKTSRASRTQSQARLNSDEAQPRTVEHNRKRRRWFSRKYYASVMRIKEFYEDNIGKTFTGILSNALNKNFGRNL